MVAEAVGTPVPVEVSVGGRVAQDSRPVGPGASDVPGVRAPLAWRPVGAAMLALAVLLTTTSGAYGYHRDELYFRMLPPQWGYLDQPPLTPVLVGALSSVVDEVWAVRLVPTVAAVVTTLVVALVS